MWWKYPIVSVGAQLTHHLRHELQAGSRAPRPVPSGASSSSRRLGETAIHGDVGVPPLAVVLRRCDHIVVEGPDGVVREALVVLGDLLGAQGDRG